MSYRSLEPGGLLRHTCFEGCATAIEAGVDVGVALSVGRLVECLFRHVVGRRDGGLGHGMFCLGVAECARRLMERGE
jgi:hypothetical protein